MKHLFGKTQDDAGGPKVLEIRCLDPNCFDVKHSKQNIVVTIELGVSDHSHRVVLSKTELKELTDMFNQYLAVLA